MVQGKDTVTESIELNSDKKKPASKLAAVLGIFLVLAILASAVLGTMLYDKNNRLIELEGAHSRLNDEYRQLNAELEKTQSDLDFYKSELSRAESSAAEAAKAHEEEVNSLNESIKALESRISEMQMIIDQHVAVPALAGNGAAHKCYLTFDDGPSDNTYKILDILKENQVKATFFVVGTSKLEYIKRIHEEGHAIGLHSDTHSYAAIYSSEEAFFNDLNSLAGKVEQIIGFRPDIIRFPGGSSNTISRKYQNGIMSKLTNSVTQMGLRYFDWNVDSGDAASNSVPARVIINNIKSGVSGKGDICILMHDSGSKRTTVEALPAIIDYLKSLGYIFDVLSQNSGVFQHNVLN
ncbi:MAG TPA: polysaccharide deacetylase [Clostridiales bacterium]|nr:polysaccharide deacetylase [Clostridiales bacterium]